MATIGFKQFFSAVSLHPSLHFGIEIWADEGATGGGTGMEGVVWWG